MALLMPWTANAQTELTVCDGTTTNEKIPVYGLYVDTQGTTSEFIIPAETEGMSDMVGCAISKVTFYISSVPTSWGSPTIQLYIGEVEGTTLSSLNGPSNFTVVNTMVWSNQQSTIEVEFNEPYTYEGGTTLFTKPSAISDGMVLYTIGTQSCAKPTGLTAETTYTVKVRANCGDEQSCWTDAISFTTAASSCTKPTDLAETNITVNSADLSWTGTSNSYVLQYRPWNPAGDDIVTTGTMTTYTVDLSQYEGTGSVAIRHYDISDMFALIVDDIQVTNANGEVVYTQNFEACGGSMPDEFTNMDLDGDGNTWAIGDNSDLNVNGTYGIISYSYDNYSGPLYPDNWLIINDIQMGGQMTFQARGQDASYAAENFAIYVSTDNSIVEVPVRETSYAATDLTPNTPYAWQVKGVCDDDESGWSSSFFKTKDDMLVFATDGNWNVVANWTDADGNAVTELPTIINNVRIDAAATIPAGELAVANKATIGTGSILIKDGGQLKQNSASLRVTMEKEIAGYGENDGYYYFIASPFNGRTLYETSGSFSHVENMLTGEYDLYAFDPTADLEWINYKSSSTHVAFQAENGLAGLLYGEGYLYANQEGTTIEFEGTATMNVYDVTGRLVNTQSVNGSCQVELNAPAGVYMIQLVNGDNTKTQKIVVK